MNDASTLAARLLDILDVPSAQRGDVAFATGSAPFADQRYDVPGFAAACIATAHMLGGGGQPVNVDVQEATEAFASERYLSIDGRLPQLLWAPLSADYQDRNGRWLRIHANFPNHAHAAAYALGVEQNPEDFRGAVLSGDAFDIEERIVVASGAAATLRTKDEWRSHSQQKHLELQPLIAFKKLTDAPPITRPRRLRVLDLTRVIAGPVAGRVLALYGADVLAVTAPSLPQIDALVVETGFGKRSTFLDLRDNEDAATFHRLVTTSDVLIESYRPGALERLGFGERACAVLNPNLVYVSISAYGDGGTWGQRRGFDSLVQMVTGIACGANAFEPPTPLPSQALDHGTGWLAAAAALAAVERTRRLGGAWYVTLSLARTADFLLSTGPRNASQNDSKTMGHHETAMSSMASAFGSLSYLPPPGQIRKMRLEYPLAPPALGSDSPVWR